MCSKLLVENTKTKEDIMNHQPRIFTDSVWESAFRGARASAYGLDKTKLKQAIHDLGLEFMPSTCSSSVDVKDCPKCKFLELVDFL